MTAPTPTTRTVYEVRDAAGVHVASHVREDRVAGGKDVRWQLPDGVLGLAGRRTASLPLYGTERVATYPVDDLLVITEGEKAADAISRAGLLGLGTVTGAGGCHDVDALRPAVAGRRVLVWPDADAAGREHGRRVAIACEVAGAASVLVAATRDDVPAGWDAADELADLDLVTARDRIAELEAGARPPLPDPKPAHDRPTRPVAARGGPMAVDGYDDLRDHLGGLDEGMRRADIRSRSVVDVAEEDDPDADRWIVEGLTRPGSYGVLAAYEGTGKSYLRTQLAFALAAPDRLGPLFGQLAVPSPVAVLVIDGENGTREERRRDRKYLDGLDHATREDVRRRYRRITIDDAALSLRDAGDVRAIAAEAERVRDEAGTTDLVLVLDSADSLYGGALYGDSLPPLLDAIRSLREGRPWLVVLLVTHMTKRNHDARRANLLRGLEDVLGNVTKQADAVAMAEPAGDLRLRFAIAKRVGGADLVLARDADDVWWRVVADGSTPAVLRKVRRDELLAWIAERGGYVIPADLQDRFGVSNSTARRELNQAVAAGELDATPEGERERMRPVRYWLPGTL